MWEPHSLPPLQLSFESYGSRLEVGPLHGLRVGTPYTSKDHLQHKRYIAQSMGTTYVYDFLELFRQVCGQITPEIISAKRQWDL